MRPSPRLNIRCTATKLLTFLPPSLLQVMEAFEGLSQLSETSDHDAAADNSVAMISKEMDLIFPNDA